MLNPQLYGLSPKGSLRDGLQFMLQTVQDNRKTNRITRLLKEGAFPYPASLEELDYNTARGVDTTTWAQLVTGKFVRSVQTIVINGPARTGKTYLAVALGDRACRLGFNVAFFTMQKLLDKIKLERLQGQEIGLVEKLSRMDMLIIDDFGMKVLEGQQQNDFQQIIDDRYWKKALIISSQLPVND